MGSPGASLSGFWSCHITVLGPAVAQFSLVGGCVPRANGFLLFLGFAACKMGRPAPTSQVHKGAGEREVIIRFSVRVQSIV